MTEPPQPPMNQAPTPEKESIFARSARMCFECKNIKTGGEFTQRGDGVCDSCAERIRVEQREVAKSERAADLMDEMLSEVGQQDGLPKIEQMCGAIIGQFGGLNGFVRYYKKQLDAVVERKTGPTVGVLNHLANLMKLVAQANQHLRQDRADQMTAEQIDREQKLMMFQMLMEASKDDATASKIKTFLAESGLVDRELIESNQEAPP